MKQAKLCACVGVSVCKQGIGVNKLLYNYVAIPYIISTSMLGNICTISLFLMLLNFVASAQAQLGGIHFYFMETFSPKYLFRIILINRSIIVRVCI